MIDIEGFLDDRGIDYRTGGKNVAGNDINICCPFCGEDRFHLGIHKRKGILNCWSCGFEDMERWPSLADLISEIDGIPIYEAIRIARDLLDDEEYVERKPEKPAEVKLPEECESFINSENPIAKWAFNYLVGRGFGADEILEYNLKFCSWGDYGYRIIVPIYFRNRLVSYLGRDFSGKQDLRYRNCPAGEFILANKELLYGYDTLDERAAGKLYVVEGCTDRWRLGNDSVAILTNRVSKHQLALLAGLSLNNVVLSMDSGSYAKGLDAAEQLMPYVKGWIKVLRLFGRKDVADLGRAGIDKIEAETAPVLF